MKFQKIEVYVAAIHNFPIKALVRRAKLFFFPSKVGKKLQLSFSEAWNK